MNKIAKKAATITLAASMIAVPAGVFADDAQQAQSGSSSWIAQFGQKIQQILQGGMPSQQGGQGGFFQGMEGQSEFGGQMQQGQMG